MNAQSSRANHWLRPMNMTTSTPIGHATHIVQRAAESDSTRDTNVAAAAAGSTSAATHDHPPPQAEKLQHAASDRRESEELGAAVRAEVVMHRRLDETRACALKPVHHLDTDDAARGSESRITGQASTEQPEVAVCVAHAQSEHELHDVVVHAPDQLAVPRVATADLVTLHDVDRACCERHEQGRLPGVVLRVAVGVEDPVVAGGVEAADQRLAVAP